MVRNTTLSGTGAPWGTPPMSGNRTTISETWAALLMISEMFVRTQVPTWSPIITTKA